MQDNINFDSYFQTCFQDIIQSAKDSLNRYGFLLPVVFIIFLNENTKKLDLTFFPVPLVNDIIIQDIKDYFKNTNVLAIFISSQHCLTSEKFLPSGPFFTVAGKTRKHNYHYFYEKHPQQDKEIYSENVSFIDSLENFFSLMH